MPDIALTQQAEWIAEQLGDGWQVIDAGSHYNCALTHTENDVTLKLWVSLEGGRLRVSADSIELYDFTWRDERFPSISCSLDKTPPQVARDIERRLLPEYRTLVAKALERKRAYEERKQKQHQLCQEIADLLRAEVREGWGRQSDPRVYCYGANSSAIEFTVMSDTSVQIEIRNATPEAAKQIADIVQAHLRYGWNKDNEEDKIAEEEANAG